MLDAKQLQREQRQATREFLVKKAKDLIGKPYKYGAKPEDAPEVFDCSSFTKYVYWWSGVNLPRTCDLQAKIGRVVRSRHPRKGDLLFFKGARPRETVINGITCWIGHIGMYIGRSQFIHCSQIKGVSIKSLKTLKYPVILMRRVI